MAVKTENLGSSIRLVTANPFEQGTAVMDHMRHYVDIGVLPRYEFAVMPNFFADFIGHQRSSP